MNAKNPINYDARKKQLAIYDFCETLVDFQTGDEFVFFVGERTGHKRFKHREKIRKKKPFSFFFRVCDRFINFGKGNFNKLFILSELKGLKKSEIDRLALVYYTERIKPHLIKPVLDRLINDMKKGDVIIVSASYFPFLTYFGKEYKIKTIITNEFEYKNELFTGRLVAKDCWGKEKVKRLIEEVNSFEDYYSVSYSDSSSDLPILEVADKQVVVSRNKPQSWAAKRGYEQIIWGDS